MFRGHNFPLTAVSPQQSWSTGDVQKALENLQGGPVHWYDGMKNPVGTLGSKEWGDSWINMIDHPIAAIQSLLGIRNPGQRDIEDIVLKSALKLGIEPALALAIAKEESGFKNVPNSKGSGAFGPMQIMPGTAKRHGLNLDSMKDPEKSVPAALAEFANLLQKHGGDVNAALKDYGGFVSQDPSQYINDIQKMRRALGGGDSRLPIQGVPAGGPALLNPLAYHPSGATGTGQPINIYVTHPNATATDIARAVRDELGKQAQRNMAQWGTTYV